MLKYDFGWVDKIELRFWIYRQMLAICAFASLYNLTLTSIRRVRSSGSSALLRLECCGFKGSQRPLTSFCFVGFNNPPGH